MQLRLMIHLVFALSLTACGCAPNPPSPGAAGPDSAKALLDEFNRHLLQPIPDWKALAALTIADSADEERALALLRRYSETAEIWRIAHEKFGPGKFVVFGRSPWLSAEAKAPATLRSRTDEEALIEFTIAGEPRDGRFRRIDGAWRIDISTFDNREAYESIDDFCKLVELNIRPFEPVVAELKEGIRSGRIRSYDELNEEFKRLKGGA